MANFIALEELQKEDVASLERSISPVITLAPTKSYSMEITFGLIIVGLLVTLKVRSVIREWQRAQAQINQPLVTRQNGVLAPNLDAYFDQEDLPARPKRRRANAGGFTLMEVVVAMAILSISMAAIINGYIFSTKQAEWTAHSLAAQSLASQAIEEAKAANWDTQMWPVVDQMPPAIYVQTNTLDVPVAGTPIKVITYVTVSQVSTNPPLRQLRADCIWPFMSRGLFTNTITTLRTPDQ